ncbi:MAG: plasmid pRiA4b ORF-3 family protein [Verrucomicrobiales bacterium]|nr:plasmid pRiA4b ORF-3 family protein [Verrucomicrobiales bacterium]
MRIELEDIQPTIWRTVILPKSAHLGWVHAVIQVAMGWTNSHLHQFSLGDVVISDPTFNLNEFEGDPPVTDEKSVTVEQVAKAKTPVLVYQYDFGDSWNHLLTFSPLSKAQHASENRAVCVGGGRACPPEDCGGVMGYEDLLEALRNKKHPEHVAMKQWLGRPYDPESFSADKVNRFLAKIPWPKVSISALGKVLGALHRAKS